MKYLSVDVETTGLDPDKHKVVMFAAVLDDTNNPKPPDELSFYSCIINQEEKGQREALEMNEWIFRMMPEQGISQAQFLVKFEQFLKDHGFVQEKGKYVLNVAGKNVAGFDNIFLNNIPGFSDKFRIRSRCIDPTILYYDEQDEFLPDLQTCLLRAGISKNVAHDALEDALDIVLLIRNSNLFKQQ